MPPRSVVAALCVAVALLTTACTTTTPPPAPPRSTVTPTPSSPNGQPGDAPPPVQAELRPTGTPRDLATDLDVPWSVVRLRSGSALISERDSARVLELTTSGELREVGVIDGVQPGGEGGLLGLAVAAGERELHAYFTAADDNRVVRMPLLGRAGAHTLGTAQPVLTGIPKARNHNGGRLAFGPDGMLYITTGDAGHRELAREAGSLAGKILRVTAAGETPNDNPFVASPVWSLGHRNPQGLAWDAEGRLWASEFGQDTWDELNIIVPGGDYGWPTVEGIAGREGLTDPVLQWSPDEASPSGMAFVGSTLFIAALRGETLWAVHPQDSTSPDGAGEPDGAREPRADAAAAASVTATPWLRGELGRLRDAIAGPNGALWVLTNETSRGTPERGDDRLVELRLVERGAG